MGKKIDTAFILGAGLGTRLRPLTENCPKPLLPIGGRPMITYAMEHLQSLGVRRFIINTHHCPEKYTEAFPDNKWQGIPLTFSHEPVLLDTAGGIKNIEDLIAAEERIIVYNGDIITNLPLPPLVAAHFARNAEVTLTLRSRGPLLNVNIDENGFVCDLRHTLNNPGALCCQFTGICIIEKKFLTRLEKGKVESTVPVWLQMIKKNPHSVAGVIIDEGCWHDVGTIGEYERLNQGGF